MIKKFTLSSTMALGAFLSIAAVTYAAGNVTHSPAAHLPVRTLSGTVTAVGTDSFTLAVQASSTAAVTTYNVTTTGARILKGATTTLASVAVDDKVFVTGTVSGASIAAKLVRDGVPSHSNSPPVKGRLPSHPASRPFARTLVGSVSSISGSSFDVQMRQPQGKKAATTTITVATDGSTVWKKDGKPGSISGLAVGNMVAVAGTSTTSGQMTARSVSIFGTWPFKGSPKH